MEVEEVTAYKCSDGSLHLEKRVADAMQEILNESGNAAFNFQLHSLEIARKFNTQNFGLSDWKCESKENPVGYCIEDHDDDEDCCLYCGEPEERK